MTTSFSRMPPALGHSGGKKRKLDRNIGRVIEVGIQTVHTTVDRHTIDRLLAEYAKGDTGLLPAPGPGGYDVLKAEPAFVLRNRTSTRDAPAIMTAINGLEKKAYKNYRNDPEMVRLIVRAQIQTIGTPLENAPRIESSLKPAVALGVAGLATLPAREASAGAGAVYDVPTLSANGGVNSIPTGSVRGGVPNGKVTLILRNRDSTQVARRLTKMAAAINEDGDKWKRTMHASREVANVWANGVRALADLAMTNGLLLVYRLLEAGILRVDETGGAGRRVPTELLAAGGRGQLPADEVTARLANLLKLTNPVDSLAGSISPQAVAQYGLLQHTFTNSVFYTADSSTGMANSRYEFGATKATAAAGGGMTFRGRFDNRRVSNTRIGAFLGCQLNAFTEASSAWDTAACDEGRLSAGRFMTGSSQDGSGAAMLSYGAHA